MDTYNVLFSLIFVLSQENYVRTGVHKMDFVLEVFVTVCRASTVKIVPFQCVPQGNIMIMMQVVV